MVVGSSGQCRHLTGSCLLRWVLSCLRFSMIGAAVLLAACGSPELKPLGPGDRILAFGDSLTFGTGVNAEQSYPSVLARLSGLDVINAGIPGETAAQGAKRLPAELEATQAALVILIEGGNDILRNRNSDLIKADLERMIRLIQQSGIPVVLLGVPEKKLFSDAAPFYRELAEQYSLVFDGELIGRLMRTPSLKSDPIHFNAAGYREMAESIYQLLRDSGAIED